jgi:hypothetical protein
MPGSRLNRSNWLKSKGFCWTLDNFAAFQVRHLPVFCFGQDAEEIQPGTGPAKGVGTYETTARIAFIIQALTPSPPSAFESEKQVAHSAEDLEDIENVELCIHN